MISAIAAITNGHDSLLIGTIDVFPPEENYEEFPVAHSWPYWTEHLRRFFGKTGRN